MNFGTILLFAILVVLFVILLLVLSIGNDVNQASALVNQMLEENKYKNSHKDNMY